MGSHYIPVSGITIDTIKDAIADALPDIIDLDILCPAAGYDTTPPDPAIYCPANGYFPDDTFVPPTEWPVLPDPSAQMIELIASDDFAGMLKVHFSTTGGGVFMRIFGESGEILAEHTHPTNTVFSTSLPSSGGSVSSGYTVFRIQVFPLSGTFTTFVLYNGILSAKINAPTLTSLANSFRYVAEYIKSVEFFGGAYNSLSRMDYAFYLCRILDKLTLPTELNALTRIDYAFYGSSVRRMTWPAALPLLSNLANSYRNHLGMDELIFPHLPELTTLNYAFNAANIKVLTFTGASNKLTNVQYAFSSSKIRKLTLPSSTDLLTSVYYMGNGMTDLEEIIFPESMAALTNMQTSLYQSPQLRYIRMPLALPLVTNMAYFVGNAPRLSIMTECAFGSGIVSLNNGITNHRIVDFNFPSLKISGINLSGFSAAPTPLRKINIDWSNSIFTENVSVFYNALDKTELDRIFTLLPTVAGRTFDARGNPGAATCDTSIAEAKGWIVII